MPHPPKLLERFQQSTCSGKEREEARRVVAKFLVSESFVLAAVHAGQVTTFL